MFAALSPSLTSTVLHAIEAPDGFGFSHMTPVQASTIPLFMTNKDVLVEATTGSGKTLAFAVPIMEILLRSYSSTKKHDIGALIIAPSRELTMQIFDVMKKLTDFQHAKNFRYVECHH